MRFARPIAGSLVLTGMGLSVMLSACADSGPGDAPSQVPAVDGAPAVWQLQPDQRLTAASTGFTALVSRLACNSGVTGDVVEPDIEIGEAEIVVTFRVEPDDPGAADCQGNDWVPYEVSVNEPIGDRALIDGQCRPGGAAEQTVFCDPGPSRWTP
ncbi:hypothetical protein [Jiangella rhizosphaerae]|uniref:Uncharacterized protein n=1 Tax=Jiangella rhizosphaerae TaxID=2293569 RepID=A0A418KLT7_9ACTN|nr:hypothetical protein [Jiangella rhizosphaerae]RIQ18887.1 hypothetical protein DY240_20665 [Jiangella rhizosphaerae]